MGCHSNEMIIQLVQMHRHGLNLSLASGYSAAVLYLTEGISLDDQISQLIMSASRYKPRSLLSTLASFVYQKETMHPVRIHTVEFVHRVHQISTNIAVSTVYLLHGGIVSFVLEHRSICGAGLCLA